DVFPSYGEKERVKESYKHNTYLDNRSGCLVHGIGRVSRASPANYYKNHMAKRALFQKIIDFGYNNLIVKPEALGVKEFISNIEFTKESVSRYLESGAIALSDLKV